MGFLRRVHVVSLRDKVLRCEICKSLNAQSLLDKKNVNYGGSLVTRMTQQNCRDASKLSSSQGKQPEVDQGPGGVISLTK